MTPLKTILARKLGMTRIFNEQGLVCPATILETGPCRVLQIKTTTTDGYDALQLGFGARQEKHVSQALLGHFKKAGCSPARLSREVRVDSSEGFSLGQEISLEGMFALGDYVDVSGVSKGRGFAGGVKRWGFRGGPKTHGQSDRERAPGSLAGRRSLGRVLPGKKMAGHLGADSVTVQKLEILKIEPETNRLYVLGAIPGAIGTDVVVEETIKRLKHKIVHAATKPSKKKQVQSKAAAAPKKAQS